MIEPDDSELRDELRREALARVHRLVSGEATVQDVEDIKRWQRQSPAHADAFAFATRLWDRIGTAGRNLRARHGEQVWSRRRLTRRIALGAVAASAAYFIAQPPLQLWPSYSELAADYRTATGEQRRITLSDGASVELNTRTSISLRPAEDWPDRFEIVSGEASITTGRETTKLLGVIAGDGLVRARSARFNIRYDSHASCVTCLDGAVDVELHDVTLALPTGHQVTYTGAGLGAVAAIDPAAVTAWQKGLLIFRDAPLSEVVAEINRYRSGKIVLLNKELGRRMVNARFSVGNVDEIMSLARQIFGADVTVFPGGIVVLS